MHNNKEREVNGMTILLAVGLTVFMMAANLYLVLQAGITIGATLPSAVIALGVLAWLDRNTNHGLRAIRANIAQTAASCGETIAAALGFSVAALVIAGVMDSYHYLPVTMIALCGGVYGTICNVSLRPVLVVNGPKEATYPEGVAGAEVLKAGARPGVLKLLAVGMGVGALITTLHKVKLAASELIGGFMLGGRSGVGFGVGVTPALTGVGYIVGFNISAVLFIGSALVWFVAIPFLGAGEFDSSKSIFGQAMGIWGSEAKFLGVGCMLVGGVWTLVRLVPKIWTSLQLLRQSGDVEEAERDIPRGAFLGVAGTTLLILAGLSYWVSGSVLLAAVLTVVVALLGVMISTLASYVCGVVGSTNSPVSGMTLMSIFLVGGLVRVMGFGNEEAALTTLVLASVLCGAACTSGNTSQDYKTGHLVGTKPWMLQTTCLIAAVGCALVAAPLLTSFTAQGFDTATGGVPAPKAKLIADVVLGFFGDKPMPAGLIWWGAGIGVALGLIDLLLERRAKQRGHGFRVPIMAAAVGMYMPLFMPAALLVGALIRLWHDPRHDRDEFGVRAQRGIIVGSGLIAGEALIGALFGVFTLFGLDVDLSSFSPIGPEVFGVIALIGIVSYIAVAARERKTI